MYLLNSYLEKCCVCMKASQNPLQYTQADVGLRGQMRFNPLPKIVPNEHNVSCLINIH